MTSTRKTIFIASSSRDQATYKPVAKILDKKSYKVIIYEADKVVDSEVSLCARISSSGGFEFWYGKEWLDFTTIRAAWCRRPSLFGPWDEDRAKQQSLDAERQSLQSGFWATIPDERWLNAPYKMQHANHKLLQLQVAQILGFTIPDTLITNRTEVIPALFKERIIFKGFIGVLQEKNAAKYVFTTILDPKDIPANANPFPGIWQPFITKKREWRITVVGDECFAVAIYTSKAAKSDWRRSINPVDVQFKIEPFPEDLAQLCKAYLRHFGLRFGAFDFIEDTSGRIVFLECNPNGQYGWLEAELKLPISEAIANELAMIAELS